MDLFEPSASFDTRPLAARMRPQALADYVGQEHLLALGRPLREAIERNTLYSMLLWGPPGVGKTTLASLLAQHLGLHAILLSAVTAGVREVRQAAEQARQQQRTGQRTLLFLDEVHRFTKAQQDILLPYLEDGTLIFIGATTENPSFELNAALLSRLRVHVLKPLDQTALMSLIQRALKEPQGVQQPLALSDPQQLALCHAADGDGRRLLNLLEAAADLADPQGKLSDGLLSEVLAHRPQRFDKQGDVFYEQISALHKSVRGSAPDAALYWYARMLEGGCDPLYIARRVVRMASEDIGNADPRALSLCLSAWDVQERLGSPEGELAIAQAIVYLACAPKSNAVYLAFKQARQATMGQESLEVPLHLRNAPSSLMQQLGYADGYRYAHDEPEAYAAGEDYFPKTMSPAQYYQPVPRGLELKIREKLEHLRQLDAQSPLKRRED